MIFTEKRVWYFIGEEQKSHDCLHAKKRAYKRRKTACRLIFWRRVWDSNPRGLAPKLISNQPRYDRFDNPPYLYFEA